MKKNILSLTLTLALVAGTFVGCGCNTTNEKTTNTTNETSINEEVSTKENTTSDSGNVGDITGENESETNTEKDTSKEVKVGCYYFPTGEGYTEKIRATEYDENADPNWSYNKTYFLDCNGNVMTFKWDGPTTLGTTAWTSDEAIIMSNSAGEYALRAFTTGEETPEGFEELKSLNKDFVITCVPGDVSYIENGYYNVNIGDDVIIFSFAIEGPVNNINNIGKGYAWLYVNKITGASYQFYYLEKLSNYDDARAWKVVESLAGISVEDFDTDDYKNYIK